jgi:hypothetical protein
MKHIYLLVVFCFGVFIFGVPFWFKGSQGDCPGIHAGDDTCSLLNAIVWDDVRALANAVFLGFSGAKVIGAIERFKERFSWNTG